MARLLTQTLTRKHISPPSFPYLTHHHHHHHHHHRHRSNKAQFIEIDLDNTSEIDIHSIRKLEEVIHSIIVRRSAPDWLPFVPGSSYWVPPPPHLKHHLPYNNLLDVIRRMSSSAAASTISEDETMSLSSVRGWPSSAYFIQGNAPTHQVPVEVEVEVRVLSDPEQAYTLDDGE